MITSAIFRFIHANSGTFSLFIKQGGDPTSIRLPLKRACTKRQSDVVAEPSTYAAQFVRWFAAKNPYSVSIIPDDSGYKAMYYYELRLVGRTPYLTIRQGVDPEIEPEYHGSIFAFLGAWSLRSARATERLHSERTSRRGRPPGRKGDVVTRREFTTEEIAIAARSGIDLRGLTFTERVPGKRGRPRKPLASPISLDDLPESKSSTQPRAPKRVIQVDFSGMEEEPSISSYRDRKAR
jgi:hypothetical protein